MPGVYVEPEREFKVTHFRVKYKDFFDLKKFYQDLHDWLKEHGWTDVDDNSDHYEILFLEKFDAAGFKEQWIRWRPQRVPNKSNYYRYWFDFDYHNVGIGKTEIVKEGKKYKVNKGEVELSIDVFLEIDFKKMFYGKKFMEFFRRLFYERIFRRDALDDHKKELYHESQEMVNWIKQWFKLKRHLPYEEGEIFFKGHAWPSHHKD